MLHSESLAKLAPALVKANAEVQHATKDSTNPHFRSTFASLNAVLDTIKPAYAAHGLTLTQMPGFHDGIATLGTMILHESGEWIYSESGSPVTKKDPQGIGSALTYLRRYSAAAIAGIGQEDDDGNDASRPSSEVAVLVREISELLRLADDSLPSDGRTAAQEAIDQRDASRLRAALAWLKDNMEVPA